MVKMGVYKYITGMVAGTGGLFVEWQGLASQVMSPQSVETVADAVNQSILHGVWFTTSLGSFDLDVFMKICCFITTLACGYKTLKSKDK